MRSGSKGSSASVFSPTPRKTIGLPVTWRTESAAPPRASPSALVRMMPVRSRVAAEGPRRIHGVLPRHGIDHEQPLRRGCGLVDLADLVHQRLIHMEPARGIDDQHVEDAAPGLLQGRARDIGGRSLYVGREVLRIHLGCEALQLQHGGGAADVGADHQYPLALLLRQPACELRRGGRLARALQAGEQHHDGRLGAQIEPRPMPAHELHQLPVQDADEGLPGAQALGYLGADGLRLHRVDEALDDGQGDVRLEKRDPHLPQGFADVLLGNAPAATQAVQGAGEA